MVGDGDEMAFLATTGIERAGVVIACTGDDEDNLVACQLAKGKFRVPRTIARVNNPVNVNVFTALGIDVPVSATELLMGLIEAEISGSEMVKGLAVKASGANLVDVKLPDMSRLVGRRLSEVELPAGDLVVCIVRARRAGAGPAGGGHPGERRADRLLTPARHRGGPRVAGRAERRTRRGRRARRATAASWSDDDQVALPILKILVPQVGQVPVVAGLPFFMVIACGSLISVGALHLRQ